MTVKLTLSVDKAIVERAKRYAARRRASVSSLVEQYLDLVSRLPDDQELPPVLKRWRGALKGVKPEAWRRHLEQKHK